MGVQLNIKDAETVGLAKKLADATGQSVTAAIKGALEDMLRNREEERVRKRARIDEMLGDLDRHRPKDVDGLSSREIMDAIYVDGLPE
ncbi:hypothetical protein ASG11_14225 [Sphingomonas sp. Leaf357]|uniref:type II toxin-antitoxin system VapB family antitoxin n=1 Tax=Sphingomonas sp. Leaf357 TaxID=1736350 RepID=UPI0006FB9434|nr:type II toxin-antitoxin system VapB family antitoxin [Sphingomonas sp. Leaf357]KQS01967.1 hypothetical protein ASG11_14225 [Sphingomonas sp. Leaf357]